MDKIIVPFEDIRGLGNIIIPKSLSDYFTSNYAALNENTDEIDGVTYNVLKLKYYVNPVLQVTPPTEFISYVDGKTITLLVRVVDENNNALHDIPIEWDVNGDFTGNLLTDSSGTAIFEWMLSTDPETGTKNYSFTVNFAIIATEHYPEVTSSVTVKTGCTLNLKIDGYNIDN